MKQTLTLVQKILQEMQSSNSSELLNSLVEELENKIDPDPVEMYLLETLCQLQEKLKITEAKLSSYLIKSREESSRNKLSDLYDEDNSYGTSSLFD